MWKLAALSSTNWAAVAMILQALDVSPAVLANAYVP
jgi:hypothetical protein